MFDKKIVAAVAFSMLTSAASAATITVHWDSPPFDPAGTNVGTIYYPVSHSVRAGAGRFEGTVTATDDFDAAELIDDVDDLFAYCFDLAQTLSTGAIYTVNPGAPLAVRDFLGAVNAYFGGGPFRWLHPANSTESAAIQLGIWEALHNDDFVLTTGNVRFSSVSAPVSGLYDDIAALRTTSPDLSNGLVMVLHSDTRQDVITGVRPTLRRVPEPGMLALVGIAAAAAAWSRRRRS